MAALGRGILILIALSFFCSPTMAREAGWVPAPQKPGVVKKSPARPKLRTPAPAPVIEPAPKTGTVYDNEPPVTEKELNRFVELLPKFRAWARKNGEEAHPIVTKDGKPDFFYSPAAARWVGEHSFAPSRFFCVLGRLAAAFVIVEEGNDLKGTRPPDMPPVSPLELELVRRHLGELLTASGTPQPIVN